MESMTTLEVKSLIERGSKDLHLTLSLSSVDGVVLVPDIMTIKVPDYVKAAEPLWSLEFEESEDRWKGVLLGRNLSPLEEHVWNGVGKALAYLIRYEKRVHDGTQTYLGVDPACLGYLFNAPQGQLRKYIEFNSEPSTHEIPRVFWDLAEMDTFEEGIREWAKGPKHYIKTHSDAHMIKDVGPKEYEEVFLNNETWNLIGDWLHTCQEYARKLNTLL